MSSSLIIVIMMGIDGGGPKVGTPIKVAMLSDCTSEEPYVVHSYELRSRFRLM
jgi:hypothetical protein